jgi:transcriptional regulator with XRE-family HTH domain
VQKFKAFRKKNNLTQEEVAAYFGVKQAFKSNT